MGSAAQLRTHRYFFKCGPPDVISNKFLELVVARKIVRWQKSEEFTFSSTSPIFRDPENLLLEKSAKDHLNQEFSGEKDFSRLFRYFWRKL